MWNKKYQFHSKRWIVSFIDDPLIDRTILICTYLRTPILPPI